jgi:hypothetical protein
MTHNEIIRAVNVLAPKAEWNLSGDNFADIVWLDESQTKPTLAQVQAEIRNPTPKLEPTVAEKLALVGLTIEDLKAALA